ncbi:putative major facilitator superfamily domain-containing protein [Rosa chinensis]|uniref:Putative major facilitator superfamily domain-containing protein n=1 Tax=Rosa chinensis TaxID=74649 RepID=A0A2P6PBB7_ROSCH|nr:putative major facilitator superfamily domain-containing protein [Rosa chinensis]
MRPRRDHSSSSSSDRRDKPISINSGSGSHSNPKPRPPQSSQEKVSRRTSYYKLAFLVFMAGQSRKWMILLATIWIQAFTGTNFDFSSYSSVLKSVLGISQVQLNYLATASDLGKVFGWSSGLALMYFPLWVVLFMAAFMGFVGYGLQWLVIRQIIVLPYIVMFLLCLLAGCSICWFNTVCFVLCIRNFPANQPLAISLTVSFNGVTTARVFLGGAVFLLIFPLCIPGIVYARDWFRRAIHSNIRIEGSGFILVDVDDLELHKELLSREPSIYGNGSLSHLLVSNGASAESLSFRNKSAEYTGCCGTIVGKDQLAMLGEEHSARLLVRRLDFWLYYIAYFCGGTIGLVYSNNLGQIAQSLGQSSNTTTLVTLYSSFSFFGRLLSAVPDYIRAKFYFARTGWLTIALLPTPVAFTLLAASGSTMALHAGTALIGLSSGFIFAAAVSITSELFGPNSVGVNHNILITNIPLGSLVYGFLAAIVYDANVSTGLNILTADTTVCMGRNCYFLTFVWWACISVLGLASSVLLFLRTRHAYDHFEHNRSTQLY